MQSFKPTLNRCKTLFYSFYRPGTFPSLSTRPPEARGAPSPPHPSRASCSASVWRLWSHRGPHSCQDPPATRSQRQSLPSHGQPLPCLGAGWQLHPTATAQKAFAFLLGAFLCAQRQVPELGMQGRVSSPLS